MSHSSFILVDGQGWKFITHLDHFTISVQWEEHFSGLS